MSTTIDAALTATILQLVTAGFTFALHASPLRAAAWTATISKPDLQRGRMIVVGSHNATSALAAVGGAIDRCHSDRDYVVATHEVQSLCVGETWRRLCALAGEHGSIIIRPATHVGPIDPDDVELATVATEPVAFRGIIEVECCSLVARWRFPGLVPSPVQGFDDHLARFDATIDAIADAQDDAHG